VGRDESVDGGCVRQRLRPAKWRRPPSAFARREAAVRLADWRARHGSHSIFLAMDQKADPHQEKAGISLLRMCGNPARCRMLAK